MHSGTVPSTGVAQVQPLTQTPQTFWPPEGGGGGQPGWGPGYPNIHTSKRSPCRNDYVEHTYAGVLKKNFTPWRVRSQQPGLGGLEGGGQRSEKCVMFGINIWIPHDILSILSIPTWGKNELLPPTICQKTSGAFGAKFGRNTVENFQTFWPF